MEQDIIELLLGFEEREARNTRGLSLDPYRQLILGFGERWLAHRRSLAAEAPGLNVWDAADLHRDEVKHCRVLHWWLDPESSHGQGTGFLNHFLEAAGERTLSAEEELSVRVRREVWEGEASRIDLVIETRQRRIWVEAKIDAGECLEQISRYSERASIGLGKRGFIGRLLTRSGTSREEVGHGFRRMVWLDVVGAMERFSSTAANPIVSQLASQYGDYLRRRCSE